MDFTNERPIYLQIKEMISRQVARGELPPGSKMPSLRDIALQLKVNPNTAQRAYRELEEEGILFTRRGQGTFVTEEEPRIFVLKKRLAEEGARSYLEGALALGLSGGEALKILEEQVMKEGD